MATQPRDTTTPSHAPARYSGERLVPHDAPASFEEHTHTRTWIIPHPRQQVWGWLNDPATFTDSQVWPYRVEFVDGGFEPGVLNTHHGPFINFAGVIGEVREPAYRDLQYNYGSYALSFRWIRPTRLQFWLEPQGADATELTMQLDSFIAPWIRGIWEFGQNLFWARFPKWADRAIRKR